MNTLSYKGYTAKIEFDPDDNILFGNIIGIRDTVGFHGESVSELKDAFHEAVDFYLESCEKARREPNKPFSGKFVVRADSSLHGEVAVATAQKEEVEIRRRDGSIFSVVPKKEKETSPFDVIGIKTGARTQDILDAIRASRAG